MALKLIACGQAGYECTLQSLETHQDELDLADVDYGIEPKLDETVPEPVPASSIGVSVTDPMVDGTGLQKHMVYTVNTSVSHKILVCLFIFRIL